MGVAMLPDAATFPVDGAHHMLSTGMWRKKLVRISIVVVVDFPDRIHVRQEEWMNSDT
jgi:hypothetical protein